MEEYFTDTLRKLKDLAAQVGREQIAPHAAEVDQHGTWPAHAMQALREAGLFGLHVPKKLGGHEQGLLALVVIAETIARSCSSSALCYSMHCVASAVIAAKATPEQEERYLRPIAHGSHMTTLALSEPGTGTHFFFPQTNLENSERGYVVDGAKHFITNGGYADSYVISTKASAANEAGEFSCLVVDRETIGMQWGEPWAGFGMRGNSSRGCRFEKVQVPSANLLGCEGDQIWYVFEVVAPYFLMAMAGVYLGIAETALEVATRYVHTRRYDHSGETLAEIPLIQYKLAEMWGEVQKAKCLAYHAARLGDLGDKSAISAICMAKAVAGETAVFVTNEAMTRCGGIAYRSNDILARLLRDARASHVMAPTTDLLKQWVGRFLLGLPLI